jgi:hypothetical protein
LADQNKILTYEINGVELADGVEILLEASAIPSTTTGLSALDVDAALQELHDNAQAKVFGTQFQYAESLVTTTNTSNTTYVTKVTLTTSSLPSGTYLLSWSLVWSSSNASREMDVRIRDNTTDLVTWVSSASRNQAVEMKTGFKILTGVSGVKTYTVQFKLNALASTISVRDTVLSLWRLA